MPEHADVEALEVSRFEDCWLEDDETKSAYDREPLAVAPSPDNHVGIARGASETRSHSRRLGRHCGTG